MKSITIKGSKRESVGKVSTKALRNAGKIPCVLYGGERVSHFSADYLSFKNLVYTPDAYTVVIELESGESHNAILQDIQFHPVTDKILHIDFYETFEDKEVTIDIPIKTEGVSQGVLRGGVLHTNLRKIKIKTLPKYLPDFISVDISGLKIGDKFYVTEIADDNYSVLHPDNTVICQVRTSRAASKTEDDDSSGEETTETTEETASS